jgi:hypothetical protein
MTNFKEEVVCINFCFKLDNLLDVKNCFQRVNKQNSNINTFKSGVISVHYDNHSGYPCTRKWMRTWNKWRTSLGKQTFTIHNLANDVGIFNWIIPKHSDARTKNAMDWHKICALQKQNHVSVSGASSKSSETHSSFWWLSPMTKHGCMGTSLKKSSSLLNGRAHHLHV